MSNKDLKIPDVVGNTPAGRGYGYGGYGKPWVYGQEGYIKKSTSITGTIHIAATVSMYIKASMQINQRYTEDETTIEDIQSWQTIGYMKLGCYDGPVLPLYLTDQTEKESGS